MEPSRIVPVDPRPGLRGDLVVQNGRLAGVRRLLTAPVTLIGQAPHCDVRLTVDEVGPVHCVLLAFPDGFHLRDLGSGRETFVNGKAFTAGPVGDGDEIVVGPFQFRLEVTVPEGAGPVPTREELEAECDALRIQAAAVVAQQAALTEEEARVRQGHTALEKQKEQLAAHLENRRRQLLELQEQTREDRATFKAECETRLVEQEQIRQQTLRVKEEVVRDRQQVDRERRRLVELRKRLKRRWHRHWDAEKAALQAREQDLAAAREKLRQDAEALRGERAAFVRSQLRFNGEVELGRRQLQDEWQQLARAQQQWEAALRQEQARRKQEKSDLNRRAAEVQAAERGLADRQRQAEKRLAELTAEVQGLEVRVRNQRLRLMEKEQERARIELTLHAQGRTLVNSAANAPGALVPVAAPARLPPRFKLPAVWERLAGMLADQRKHLIEQWQQLLEIHSAWKAEHEAALLAVEAAAHTVVQQVREEEDRLELQERALAVKEQAMAAGLTDLGQRMQALSGVRCALEGWQARLTAREAGWEAERAALLAEVHAREEAAAAEVRRLEEVHERRLRRGSEEMEAVEAARERLEQLRRDYAILWQECQERRASLAREQRVLDGQSLALEDLRQELLPRAADPAAASRRLERLQKRQAVRLEAEERALEEDRQALVAEVQRLEERNRLLHQQEDDLIARHDEWARQVAAWEDQRLATADAEVRRQQEVQRLQAQRLLDQRQLAQLREELERIARLLMDEAEPLALEALAVNRAA
jgi:pSer/pThr/pTyr-binding forkhead associated (FHA) protein